MQCEYYDAAVCRSCSLLEQPYPAQLARAQTSVEALLAPHGDIDWLPAFASAESGFRNKAKMVVGGTARHPTLGILDPGGRGVDLSSCPLYPASLRDAFPVLAEFIAFTGLVPYDVPQRRGELKYVIVTESPDRELMVRFVARSEASLPRIRRRMPWLLERLPHLAVASVNLHPEHKAVLEGDTEIVLTERTTLPMRLGGIELHVRPQGFFQTNTAVAEALYAEAAAWIDEVSPTTLWDLYCGVGGFALHAARADRDVVGIETSAEAVDAARQSARELGVRARFHARDATEFATSSPSDPDLVIVNPPRRGIGPELAAWLERSRVDTVVYSSCNPASLAKDLAAMPSLRPVRARVYDMFPHTPHVEVLTLLTRR